MCSILNWGLLSLTLNTDVYFLNLSGKIAGQTSGTMVKMLLGAFKYQRGLSPQQRGDVALSLLHPVSLSGGKNK